MLSKNFTLAVSAQNLGVAFDNNFILDSMFHKLVVAAFIIFVTFVVFAGMSFAVARTIATALVSIDLIIQFPL